MLGKEKLDIRRNELVIDINIIKTKEIKILQ